MEVLTSKIEAATESKQQLWRQQNPAKKGIRSELYKAHRLTTEQHHVSQINCQQWFIKMRGYWAALMCSMWMKDTTHEENCSGQKICGITEFIIIF